MRSHSNRITLMALAILLLFGGAARAQVFNSRVTGIGWPRMTVSNFGTLGNNFVTRQPSFEYPIDTGYEHLTHAGLWIGAFASDAGGPFVGVTTAAMDQTIGTTLASLTEFTPVVDEIVVRSSLANSPFYHPDARSEEETIVQFDDRVAKLASGEAETNRPMGLSVRQVTESWSYSGLRNVIIVRNIIRGAQPLANVWVGMYTEFASGPKNIFSTWPPGGAWFNRKLLGWEPAQRLVREHYCASNLSLPTSCQFSVCPPWVGLQLLTAPAAGQQLTLAAWDYRPAAPERDTDSERHAIMSAGTITDVTAFSPGTNDPVELLAVGPFALSGPSDSIEVAFAFVGGSDLPALLSNAAAAQSAHDQGYPPIVDVKPASPRTLGLVARPEPGHPGQVRLTFTLPNAGPVRLELFDLGGRRLAGDALGEFGPGTHEATLSGAGRLPPGIYLARLTHPSGRATARAVLLR